MGKKTEFLYLSEPDMIKAGVLDSAHCVDVLDEMFKLLSRGDYVMGGPNGNEHGIRIFFPKEPQFPGIPADGPDRRFMAMVAYLGGRFHIAGEKWYGSNIENPKHGLPRSVLMAMLNDVETGEPIALMSANLLSAVRTGSVPGVGVRYLARKSSQVCGIIGAGPINRACLQGIIAEAKNLKKIGVSDINDANANKFIEWATSTYKLEAVKCKSTEEAVRMSDIISVAASSLGNLVIKNEWLQKGSTMLMTGDAKLDNEYMTSAKIVFDNPKMFQAYLDDAHRSVRGVEAALDLTIAGCMLKLIDNGTLPPLSKAVGIGDIADGKQAGRTNDDDRYLFQTSGMPVDDVAWGFEIYNQAKKMGLGQTLKVWDSPYWS